jgi:hypothetical protein
MDMDDYYQRVKEKGLSSGKKKKTKGLKRKRKSQRG